jgi:hypothetical protein
MAEDIRVDPVRELVSERSRSAWFGTHVAS